MYKVLLSQFGQYTKHVTTIVGGVYMTVRTVEEKGDPYVPVPKARQKQAVAFLNEQVFQTPHWLFNKEIAAKYVSVHSEVNKFGIAVLASLIYRAGNIQDNIRMFGAADNYPVSEFFNDVKKGVWSELVTGANIETYRRDLQTAYIGSFIEMLKVPADKPVGASQAEMIALIRLHLTALQREIKAALLLEKDFVSKAHLQFSAERIEDALHPKK